MIFGRWRLALDSHRLPIDAIAISNGPVIHLVMGVDATPFQTTGGLGTSVVREQCFHWARTSSRSFSPPRGGRIRCRSTHRATARSSAVGGIHTLHIRLVTPRLEEMRSRIDHVASAAVSSGSRRDNNGLGFVQQLAKAQVSRRRVHWIGTDDDQGLDFASR